MPTIRIPERFQGPTGSGQGGWTAWHLAHHADGPVTVSLRAPIPLDRDLDVVHDGESMALVTAEAPDTPIMIASPLAPDVPSTTPVRVADARVARSRFPATDDDHPVPFCFSCGLQADSMRVHAGPLGDGRYAADWTVPAWAVAEDRVDAALWAAIDCTAAWYACTDGDVSVAFTVQLEVEIIRPIEPEATYALVSWPGSGGREWDGRKRSAAAAAFDESGEMVAWSRSLWVRVSDPA